MSIEQLTKLGFTFTQNPEGNIHEFERGEVTVTMYPKQPAFKPDVHIGDLFVGNVETVGELTALLKRKGVWDTEDLEYGNFAFEDEEVAG